MNSIGHFPYYFLRRLPLFAILTCVCLSLAAPTTRAQDLYDFNQVASDFAREIEKAAGRSVHTTVLVTDFNELDVPDSQLAVVLAQNFSHSLRSRAGNFTILDRIDIEDAISNHKLPVGALSSRTITACYAPELGATLIVGGRIEYTPQTIVLDLDIQPTADGSGIWHKRIITPLTPAMEALKSKPAVHTEAIFGEDKTVWVRNESSNTTIPSATSGTAGYSYPACDYCPQAQFSNAAVKAKVTGTVTLSVVIGPDGKAQRISVQRGLPCDLDQQAIEAVKGWRFKAATGPDGKPAAVNQTIEVTFHLY
jgi:TonB family protein